MKLSSVNSNQTPAVFMPEKSAGANADIQALEKKLQQLQHEKQKAVQRKDEKEQKKLEKQIEEIKKQIQQLERSKKQSSKTSSPASEQKGDTYEPQSENRSAGVYKISRDEKGRPVVETGQKPQERQKQVSGEPDEQGEQPIIMKTTGNTDQVDREIENLKQAKTQMEQKIAAAKDEREKQVLKTRLEQVKAELRMKDNDTYRRQHMQITEQKDVSKIGE